MTCSYYGLRKLALKLASDERLVLSIDYCVGYYVAQLYLLIIYQIEVLKNFNLIRNKCIPSNTINRIAYTFCKRLEICPSKITANEDIIQGVQQLATSSRTKSARK